MGAKELPATEGARKYKKLLSLLAVLSIGSIAISMNSLIGHLVDLSLEPTRRTWISVAVNLALILGGGGILWIARRGGRHNLAPPEWAVLALVLLSWVVIFLQNA